MLRLLSLSLLLLFSLPAMAIYKCESGTSTTYSETPCVNSKSSDLGNLDNKSTAADVAGAKQQNEQDKVKLKQLENARHKREAQEYKQQKQADKAAASKQKRCTSLAQKKKWADEDAHNAIGTKSENAKRKAHRAAEKYTVECGS